MNKPIGIFDSGIGGVTVLREIIKILPNEEYIYYSDSLYNPYGDRTQKEIQDRSDYIVQYLIDKNCKAIVIACNTATAMAVNYLRSKYTEIPIIAIEPAYKMVYDYSYKNPTLVMATKGTIKSERFNILLKKYDNKKTTLLPCIGLADIIEKGDQKEIRDYLNKNISKYKGKVKNVVLGCTHYPLIEKEIKEVLGEDIIIFQGAERLAIHLKDVLEEKGLIQKEKLEKEKINDSNEIEIIEGEKTNKSNLKEKNRTNIIFIDSSNNDVKKERFYELLK